MATYYRDPAEVLKSARARIEDPARWTNIAAARDQNRSPVEPTDPKAVSWCGLGSLELEIHHEELAGNSPEDYHVCHSLLSRAAERLYGRDSLADVNDQEGHRAALNLIDAALQMLDGERCYWCAHEEERCQCPDQ